MLKTVDKTVTTPAPYHKIYKKNIHIFNVKNEQVKTKNETVQQKQKTKLPAHAG